MSDLTKAILIATQAHDGQLDKGNHPYILHPLRLLTRASTDKVRIVAVLHDVVEDTDITLEQLRDEGFDEEIVEALDCLSRRQHETYDEFIERIQPNALARAVKLLDLEDNCDVSRIADPSEEDYKRIEKYQHAIDRFKQ